MILYTPMPPELVLKGMDDERPALEEVTIDGVTMQIEMNGLDRGKIVRLLSPDPMHYLNPDYAPGQWIHFAPAAMNRSGQV